MAKGFDNLWTYIIFVVLFLVMIVAIQNYASSLLTNDNVVLVNEDTAYIATILDIDLSGYSENSSVLGQSQLEEQDEKDGSAIKDFALEFFYSRSKVDEVLLTAKNFLLFPTFLAKLFKIPIANIEWLLNILNFFWLVGFTVAGYWALRGVK